MNHHIAISRCPGMHRDMTHAIPRAIRLNESEHEYAEMFTEGNEI